MISEPTLLFDKSVPTTNTDSARTVEYAVTIDHTATSTNAHDVFFIDDLDAIGMTYVT